MITIKNLCKSYEDKTIFYNADFCIEYESKIYTILGESGSGKTTFLQILLGVDTNYDGTYLLDSKNTKKFSSNSWAGIRSSNIQIVYQDFKLLESFTVFENLYYSSINELTEFKANLLLEIFNINELLYKKVSTLSLGEKQRVAFARALVNEPKILILDEPTGNLDDKNTTLILDYILKIKKSGTIVIIVTHDSRVLSYSDEIFCIENHRIKKTSVNSNSSNLSNNTIFMKDIYFIKDKATKYTLTSIKQNIIDITLNNIPVTALFLVFIFILGFLWNISIADLKSFYGGLSKDAIFISSTNYTDKYRNELNEKKFPIDNDGDRINFSINDLESAKKIEGVKDAIVYNGSSTYYIDTNSYSIDLELDKNDMPNIIKSIPSFIFYPRIIAFKFSTLNVPKNYIKFYNPKGIDLLYGSFPKDMTDEIIVPDFYEMSCVEKNQTLLDKYIDLPVMDFNHNKVYKSYKVVGVYETDYKNNLNNIQYIYLGYRQEDLNELINSDETYTFFKNVHINSSGKLEGSVFETKEKFIEAMGTGLDSMILVLHDSKNAEKVSNEVKKLFPNLKFLSHSEFSEGEYSSLFINIVKLIIFVSLIISFVFGVIIVFLNKSYIKRRNKELATLYSLGYKKSEIYKIIMIENLLILTTNYIFAYVFLWVLNQIYFQYSKYYKIFLNIFLPHLFLIGYSFIFIMTIISIVWAISSISTKNLQKYLR